MGLFNFISDALISTITTNTSTSSSSPNKYPQELPQEIIPSMITSRIARSYMDSLENSKNESMQDIFANNKISKEDAIKYVAAGFVAANAAKHVVDNYVRETVYPVAGSIVYCDLACVFEHSGICIGDGYIVHLDGNNTIDIVSYKDFLKRLGGFNPAFTIYVSCTDTTPIGDTTTALRAIEMAGTYRDYNIILDNCHQFTSGCITGNFENSDNFWWMLKDTVEKKYPVNCWRALKMD